MPRTRIPIIVSAAVLSLVFLSAIPNASAYIDGDPGQVMSSLQDIQNMPWPASNYSGYVPGQLTLLDGAETAAVSESIAGSAGILAMGPIGLAAGGVLVIQSVWDSGFGSAIGTWLANTTPLYTDGILTNEQWCPYAQTSVSGPYGTATNTLPTSISSACGASSVGFRTVAQGAKAPPMSQQSFSAHINTDTQDYYTLQFQGNCLNGISNNGVFGSAGNAGSEFSMLFDTGYNFGGAALGSTGINISERAYQCLNSAFSDWTFNGLSRYQVKVDDGSCVIISGTNGVANTSATGLSSGSCGSTGFTCDQEIIKELGPAVTGTVHINNTTEHCYFPIASVQEMLDMLGGLSLKPCGFSGQPTCVANSNAQFHIGTTSNCSTAGCNAALNQISNGGDTVPGLPDTSSVTHEVTCHQSGTCTKTENIPLPKPKITETYDQYVNRLRSLGFWGFITSQDDDMDYPAGTPANLINAGQVTEIQIGTATPIPLYYPFPGHGLSGAPSSTPKAGENYPWTEPDAVPPGKTITILKAPPDWNAPSGPGASGGGGSCDCPGIDFTPLTGISYGTKFPFGAFTLLNSATDSFAGAGNGTPVSFTIPLLGDSRTISFQSDKWENDYRPIVFPIIELLMTLGGVVWLALRLIGHPGGDEE